MKNGIGLAQAFRTLSIFNFPGKDATKASTSLFFYPLVGFVLGALSTLIPFVLVKCFAVIDSSLLYLLMGAVFTLSMALFTRGFHLDGLGDTADGFGGGWTKEKILEIMSDSRTGSFGVAAIASVLILKTISSAVLFENHSFLIPSFCVMLSRFFVVFFCSFSQYAKEKGLSYELVSKAGIRHSLVAVLYILAASLVFLNLGVPYLQIACSFCCTVVAMLVLYVVSYRKIGGITGDVLGACAEITEVVSLFVSSLF